MSDDLDRYTHPAPTPTGAKVVTVPAETWRLVVEALEDAEQALRDLACKYDDHGAGVDRHGCWRALEAARKVKP